MESSFENDVRLLADVSNLKNSIFEFEQVQSDKMQFLMKISTYIPLLKSFKLWLEEFGVQGYKQTFDYDLMILMLPEFTTKVKRVARATAKATSLLREKKSAEEFSQRQNMFAGLGVHYYLVDILRIINLKVGLEL
jgi:hypothetical protein